MGGVGVEGVPRGGGMGDWPGGAGGEGVGGGGGGRGVPLQARMGNCQRGPRLKTPGERLRTRTVPLGELEHSGAENQRGLR